MLATKLENLKVGKLCVGRIPAFDDNYLWVVHNETHAIAIDPGDAAPVIAYLQAHHLTLAAIMCTHHHHDHVGGVAPLIDFYGLAGRIPVYGPANDVIPMRTVSLKEDDRVAVNELPNLAFKVLDVPGHTAGHIAYYAAEQGWLFCGDTLFACGCGRLFEGTAAAMQASLAKLKALPPATQVFCAHEYTLSNIRFAEAVEPDNLALKKRKAREAARREHDEATVPFTMADELACNPFLRWDSAAVITAANAYDAQLSKTKHKASSGVQDEKGSKSSPALVFGAIREWKNGF